MKPYLYSIQTKWY